MKSYRAEVVFLVDDATDEALTTEPAATNELTSWLESLGGAVVAVSVNETEPTQGGRS